MGESIMKRQRHVHRSITLKDIARMAEVNVSTVSRALNDSNEINEETKKKINKIAEELKYVPNPSAKALVGKKTKSIGIIVPEISSIYFAQMLNNIESELKERGYSLIVGMTHHKYRDEINYLNIFSIRNVDGIIVAGSMYKELEKYLADIKRNYDIPIVLIQTFIPFPDYDYIMVDDSYGFNLAIEHLVSYGHNSIGFIADEVSSKMRLPKFKAAMDNVGLKYNNKYVKVGKEMFELGGYKQMNRLMEEKVLPTAIFASYDYIAIGAMKALNEHGLSVPEDISIIGYDNIREAAYLSVPLTTVSPPIQEMTKIGVKLLIDKIENKEHKVIQHVSLKPELIIRETTKNLQ